MLFTGLRLLRIVKNCDFGLENAFSSPRSQFFTIRTSQPANNLFIVRLRVGPYSEKLCPRPAASGSIFIACVASVSVQSECNRRAKESFGPREKWGKSKKVEGRGGEEERRERLAANCYLLQFEEKQQISVFTVHPKS